MRPEVTEDTKSRVYEYIREHCEVPPDETPSFEEALSLLLDDVESTGDDIGFSETVGEPELRTVESGQEDQPRREPRESRTGKFR